jgi:hypothetical protein
MTNEYANNEMTQEQAAIVFDVIDCLGIEDVMDTIYEMFDEAQRARFMSIMRAMQQEIDEENDDD